MCFSLKHSSLQLGPCNCLHLQIRDVKIWRPIKPTFCCQTAQRPNSCNTTSIMQNMASDMQELLTEQQEEDEVLRHLAGVQVTSAIPGMCLDPAIY